MAYQALVHRATGILYFSYWPRQARTWQSVASLNREIQRLIPRLVAPGRELTIKAEAPAVQIRARSSLGSASGLIIAINTSPKFVETTIQFDKAPGDLNRTFEGDNVKPGGGGRWTERFPPYGVQVYTWGAKD
jgi:hypothetical protein